MRCHVPFAIATISKSKLGFTIVELLIVIVVIAILATITIVAYSGIQQRARTSSLMAAASQMDKSIALAKAETDSFPTSISSCPTPAAGAACLTIPSGYTTTYQSLPQGPRPAPVTAGVTSSPSYEITLRGTNNAIYRSPAERTGTNEFLQYMDMAPLIDQYGLKPYEISFDIKSANVSSSNSVQVYMQNGSSAKYSFYAGLTVTTAYTRQTVIVTPASWTSSDTSSILAFYGAYNTGNIPSVRNVEIRRLN